MIRSLVLALLLVFVAGCFSRSYEVRGIVVGFGDDGRTVIIDHEEVQGYMPAMTMPFTASDAAELAPVENGQRVAFTLHVNRDSSWIDGLEVLPDTVQLAVSSPRVPTDTSRALLEPGDVVPPITLVDERGGEFTRASFRGQPSVLTFIYTRCPLPDFCPRLSSQFQELQRALARRGSDVQLVSVTIDPEYDTPEVLRTYAERYDADPSRWTFVTGTPGEIATLAHALGVYYAGEGTALDHNLSTTLLDADGRVVEIWRGTTWQPEAVLEAIDSMDRSAD